jgi:hypothetical protein
MPAGRLQQLANLANGVNIAYFMNKGVEMVLLALAAGAGLRPSGGSTDGYCCYWGDGAGEDDPATGWRLGMKSKTRATIQPGPDPVKAWFTDAVECARALGKLLGNVQKCYSLPE